MLPKAKRRLSSSSESLSADHPSNIPNFKNCACREIVACILRGADSLLEYAV